MNNEIATGHLLRCMSIADAARTMGHETIFILADEEAAPLLKERGYLSIVLHSDWYNMDGELESLIAVVQERRIERLLIDSYQVTGKYLKELERYTNVAYIDDLNAFHYPVDILICYANYWKKFHYEQHYQGVKLYLGEKYVPLRREFCCCEKKQIKENIENLLLISGGTDCGNVIGKILAGVCKLDFQNIYVICGRYNSHWDVLQEMYASQPNIQMHKNVMDVKAYFDKADLVISAGGSTLYELCACGTPAISYALADNQLDNVKQFSEDGLIEYAGDVRYVDVAANVMSILKRYSYKERIRRSQKMQGFVDGKGAMRLAKILVNK